jgi:hypothetical protein
MLKTMRAVAVLGLLIVLGGAAPVPPSKQIDTPAEQAGTVPPAATAPPATATVEKPQQGPAGEADAVRIQRERENTELQRRAAIAAERSTQISAWQLILGIVGAIGLGYTLYYAHRSAELSRQGLALATDTAKRQLRAYVADSETVVSDIAAGYPPTFTVIFKNGGSTPAMNFLAWGSIDVFKPGQVLPTISQHSHPGPGNMLGVAEQIPLRMSAPVLLSAQQAADILAGIDTVAAQMTVRYDDIFGDTHVYHANIKTIFMNNQLRTVLY